MLVIIRQPHETIFRLIAFNPVLWLVGGQLRCATFAFGLRIYEWWQYAPGEGCVRRLLRLFLVASSTGRENMICPRADHGRRCVVSPAELVRETRFCDDYSTMITRRQPKNEAWAARGSSRKTRKISYCARAVESIGVAQVLRKEAGFQLWRCFRFL